MNQRFGRLTITRDLGMRSSPFSTRKRHIVECICDCGQKTKVRFDQLKQGQVESCGCLMRERVRIAALNKNRSKVVIGSTYGFVTVLERLPNNSRGAAVYKCKCKCGYAYCLLGGQISGSRLLRCRKCGHRDHLAALHENNKKPTGESACYAAFLCVKRNCAEKRNLPWSITIDEWKHLTGLPCHYCGCSPSNHYKAGRRNGGYDYNGLDRVDNDMGYTLKNVVPCCKRCNHAKSDQSVAEFLEWATRVYIHSNNCKN